MTPDINEYIRFVEKISEYKDYFFIFMPHPRFKAPTKDYNLQELACSLVDSLERLDNVYIDTADDYRNSLMNADYIIVDRSAVMVEAAAVQAPVLFMYNPDYFEPVTDAIRELIDSYYQGSTFDDMVGFMEMIRAGKDPRKEEREAAFRKCIPYFDGKCAERIMDDIESGLKEEIASDAGDFAKLQEYIEAVVEKKLKVQMAVIPTSFGIYGTCVSIDAFDLNKNSEILKAKKPVRATSVLTIGSRLTDSIKIEHESSWFEEMLKCVFDGRVFQVF